MSAPQIMVPLARLERALLAELDFESSASTNSATGARARHLETRRGGRNRSDVVESATAADTRGEAGGTLARALPDGGLAGLGLGPQRRREIGVERGVGAGPVRAQAKLRE